MWLILVPIFAIWMNANAMKMLQPWFTQNLDSMHSHGSRYMDVRIHYAKLWEFLLNLIVLQPGNLLPKVLNLNCLINITKNPI